MTSQFRNMWNIQAGELGLEGMPNDVAALQSMIQPAMATKPTHRITKLDLSTAESQLLPVNSPERVRFPGQRPIGLPSPVSRLPRWVVQHDCDGEFSTYLGDRSVRTSIANTVTARGEAWVRSMRDNPKHCQSQGLLDPARPGFWNPAATVYDYSASTNASASRGFQWADCHTMQLGCFTILPPNSELCGHALFAQFTVQASMSSQHPGGCHVLMGDGAVRFITDSIEAGGASAGNVWLSNNPGAQSQYGLWGGLGTGSSSEVITEGF